MKIGLVIADTYADKRWPRLAVERTLRALPADEVLVLSDQAFVAGARHVPIEPMRGIEDYNALILERLADYVTCDAYLVVQWDGFALDARQWRPDFLAFDYVGAPWLHRDNLIGSGGFSLRSSSLVRSARDFRRRRPDVNDVTPEDVQICVEYRNGLEALGFKFATAEAGREFSFERYAEPPAFRDPPSTFGFHGAFNFPLVLLEAEILELFEPMVERMSAAPGVWALFVWHAWRRGYEGLVGRALTALGEKHPLNWARVAAACLEWGMPRAAVGGR